MIPKNFIHLLAFVLTAPLNSSFVAGQGFDSARYDLRYNLANTNEGANTTTLNITSNQDNYNIILCGTRRPIIANAIDDARLIASQGTRVSGPGGPEYAAYLAMFKSDGAFGTVRATLGRITRTRAVGNTQAVFSCVQPSFARGTPTERQVWATCQAPRTYFSILRAQSTMFICPAFWIVPPQPRPVDPMFCPRVFANQFADNARAEIFQYTQAAIILTGLLNFSLDVERPIRDVVTELNNAIRRSIAESAVNLRNYLFYTNLLLYRCTQIPDIHQPPWNALTAANATTTASGIQLLNSSRSSQSLADLAPSISGSSSATS